MLTADARVVSSASYLDASHLSSQREGKVFYIQLAKKVTDSQVATR